MRLCLQAASLSAAAAQGQAAAQARLNAIEQLATPSAQASAPAADSLNRVCKALAAACAGEAPLCEAEVQRLVCADTANGYGIMAPPGPNVRSTFVVLTADPMRCVTGRQVPTSKM